MTNLHHLRPPTSRAENRLLTKATAVDARLIVAFEIFHRGLDERDPVAVARAVRAINSDSAWLMEAAREAGV